MEYVLDDWKDAIKAFGESVEKSLEEVRECKIALQELKPDNVDGCNCGKYIRDDRRLIISAPEIVIGNVDKDGNLLGAAAGSTIILRSNGISLEGVSSIGSEGDYGTITSRAASIRQIAADPGVDGLENVVQEVSEISSIARAVNIVSNDDEGVFTSEPGGTTAGVFVRSDNVISLDASASVVGKKSGVEDRLSALEKVKSGLKKSVSDGKKKLDSIFKTIEDTLSDSEQQSRDIFDVRGNVVYLDDLRISLDEATAQLAEAFSSYSRQLSSLAEVNRQIACLKDIKDALPKEDDFKKKSTGAAVRVNGESVSITTNDADGNIRSNPEAGLSVRAQTVSVESTDISDALQKEGSISLHARTLNLSTADNKYDDEEKRDKADRQAVGDVHIISKNVIVEAVDNRLENNETKEKEFTKDGSLSIRVENVSVSATDTKGKAVGKVAVNAKDVEIKSFDVKEDDRSDDKLAAGSTLVLTAEKVFAGSRDKNNKTKQFQVSADKTGIFGDSTAEVQQGEAKAVVQLDGGNLSVSGSKTQLFGETTVNGKTSFKADVEAPKASIGNLEAKSSFKSTSISDGIAVPGAPSTAKLSAKLKAEEKK